MSKKLPLRLGYRLKSLPDTTSYQDCIGVEMMNGKFRVQSSDNDFDYINIDEFEWLSITVDKKILIDIILNDD